MNSTIPFGMGNARCGPWVLLATATFLPFLARAQSQDANSREVSVFNFGSVGLPSASVEAISREVSVYNFGQLGVSSDTAEALSREVSVFNFGQLSVSSDTAEALSREVSVFNFGALGQSAASLEAISREVSVVNYGAFGLPSTPSEAISREVSVMNYGVPSVKLAVGLTNILGNAVNQVPLSLQTVLDLTNLSLTLLSDDSRLQVLGVTPVASEVLAMTLGTPSLNSHSVSFTLNSSAIPLTNHTLGYLNFQGITNLDSAVVPLIVFNPVSFRASGQLASVVATNGQVILIVTKPILFSTNRLPLGFTMYGIPGATYSIQATTNLAPADWHELERLLESGAFLIVPGLTNQASQQFYRTEQVGP